MGSEICKAGPAPNQVNTSYRQIPELTDKLRNIISLKRPFEKQLQSQKQYLKKYPDGIYEGPINIMNNPGGFGKLYKKDGSLYVGHFFNGKADGKGILIFSDGSYAEGIFSNNFFKNGEFSAQGFKYVGQFKNNLFDGEGQETNIKDGYQFEGEYENGKKKKGTMRWKNNKIEYIYQGKFTPQGQFQSGGKLTEDPLGFYIGQFRQNKKHGNGVYQYHNGIKYEGQYVDGNKQGYGKLYNGNGSISYEGNFKNGLPHGVGKAFNKEGKATQTSWIEGIDQSIIQH